MAYEILERRDSITTYTLVKYDFLDEPVLIPHFQPQSEADIILGIENRQVTELEKLNNV